MNGRRERTKSGYTPTSTTSTSSGTTLISSRTVISGNCAQRGLAGPSSTRWSTVSMYAAAATIPSTDTAVCHGHTPNVPASERNSPTNPLKPGRPSDANPNT